MRISSNRYIYTHIFTYTLWDIYLHVHAMGQHYDVHHPPTVMRPHPLSWWSVVVFLSTTNSSTTGNAIGSAVSTTILVDVPHEAVAEVPRIGNR